jgi:hypothetical protein
MRCQTCGEELREGARFCPTCGTPTQPSATATPPTVQIRRSASEPVSEPVPEPAPPPAEPEQPLGERTVAAEPQTTPDPGAETIVVAPSRSDTRAAREPGAEGERTIPRDPGAGYDPVARMAPGRGASTAPPATPSAAARGFTTPSAADFNLLVRRLLRLLRLDTSVFADLYADASATVPVAIFAAAVLVLSGIGGMLYISSGPGFDAYDALGGIGAGEFFVRSVILGTVFALVMLAAWSGITKLLLRQVGGVDADVYGIARVLGVALVPLVLSLLLVFDDGFDALGWIALGGVASLALLGVLEAVNVRPGPAWLATIAGFAVFVIVLAFLGHGGRDYAPGFFIGGFDITINLPFDLG